MKKLLLGIIIVVWFFSLSFACRFDRFEQCSISSEGRNTLEKLELLITKMRDQWKEEKLLTVAKNINHIKKSYFEWKLEWEFWKDSEHIVMMWRIQDIIYEINAKAKQTQLDTYYIDFSDWIWYASKDEKIYIIDKDGEFLNEEYYTSIVVSPLGIALVRIGEQQWILIADGSFIIPMGEYDDIDINFADFPFFSVGIDKKDWDWVENNREYYFDFDYRIQLSVGEVNGGEYEIWVKKNGKIYYLVDKNGDDENCGKDSVFLTKNDEMFCISPYDMIVKPYTP